MKYIHSLFLVTAFSVSFASAQEGVEEDVFEYTVGEVNYFTGEGANVGGFLFPELFVIGTGGVTESGGDISDFASGVHDPFNDVGIQGVEVDLFVNINDVVTGLIAGSGFQIEDHEWQAELEEAFLHYHVNGVFAIGGGQFLNAFGFTSTQHVHAWEFVNQNLVNTRMLNEGHFFMQGGEAIFQTPNAGVLAVALGGVAGHSHDHDHEHEEEGHDEEHEEEHFDYHDAEFNDWVFSADYKFRLPFDDSILLSASVATGENGFGGDQHLYGVGLQKVWNGHDHGNGGPEFCEESIMFRSEFIGRNLEAIHEDVDIEKFDDYGLSTLLAYGLSERTTLSFRHDWVSALEELELSDTHRFSPALTTYIDPAQRVRMRLQYDNVQSSAIDSEHVAWIQFQWQWGGEGGSHASHNH